jgi:hypothetical protein
MCDLPQSVSTIGWNWEQFTTSSVPPDIFWVGTDREGNRWLTKLRGSFYAYREIVFARLAQAMNWSCQSSVFLKLDSETASKFGVDPAEIHAAHWFLQEHNNLQCSAECAIKFLLGKEIQTVDDLHGSQIAYLTDWPKSEYAAYLFGGNEPPGRLFTTAHEFVIIDSEQMFATEPSSFENDLWLFDAEGLSSASGRELALQVCLDLIALTDQDFTNALSIPNGIRIRENWPIEPLLNSSREYAASFVSRHS